MPSHSTILLLAGVVISGLVVSLIRKMPLKLSEFPQSSVAVAAVVAANEPTRAEALLIAYADKNSIDADELKQFMKDYVQIKFAD